ncbi:MAG: hypothetical protein KGO05_11745, partial [Chloroflexota bacterium]|nr:hypothetical protein [Chloroflexota bacterium]
MRIERLSVDNQRTQGAERRNWYRKYSAKHLKQIELALLAALDARAAATPDSAVVLGAGACTELPLDQLARACLPVTLVDLDTMGMLRARDELPATLRERVRTISADLTGGVSSALQDELRAQPWPDLRALGGGRGASILDAVADCLERVPVAEPPDPAALGLTPGGYGLVVSSLTLTQLYSLPLLDALDTLLVYAPDLADERAAHPRYQRAERGFQRRVVAGHLALIKRLLAPGGVALLITDYVGHLLAPQRGAHASEGRETLDVLPAEV